MKLKTLKPRIGTLSASKVQTLGRAGATERTRGSAWMKTRAAWLRAHPMCVECEDAGYVTAGEEVDHVVPLWEGGADDETNYQTLCHEHHAAKTADEAKRRGRS